MPDKVDAIAEAEVYAAYGRYTQAREILEEALARDPSRHDVRAMLDRISPANVADAQSQRLGRLMPGVFIGGIGYIVVEISQHTPVTIAGVALMAVAVLYTFFTVKRFKEIDRAAPGKDANRR